jgi:hypothetical protein
MNAVGLGILIVFSISLANPNWANKNFQNESAIKFFGISKINVDNSIFKLIGDTTNKNEEEVVLEKVYKIPEVKKKDHFIDSLTNHKHGISMIILERPNENKLYYVVQVGYNNEIRFEPYYTFYVYKKNFTVKFYDPIPGEIITLKEWRKRNNKNTDER